MSASHTPPDRVLVAAWPFDVRPGEVETNLARARQGLEQAAARGARLLVLPEKWTTSYLSHYPAAMRAASDEALAALHADAVAHELVVTGSALGGDGDRPYNEQHVLGVAGDLRPYRKRMLFSPMDEARSCRAGRDLPELVPTPVGRLLSVICYDLRFPEVTRPALLHEADLLAVPAEWPTVRLEAFELFSRARAAENQCWLLSCNRAGSLEMHGESVAFPGTALLVDPTGRVVARTDDGELLVGEVDHARSREVRAAIPCKRDLEQAGL